MATGEDDPGLELRLPWDRPERPGRPPVTIAAPAPRPPVGPARTADRRPSPDLEVLLLRLEDRFERLDEQLGAVPTGLTERLDQIEGALAGHQAVLTEALEGLQARAAAQAQDGVFDDMKQRLDWLESLIQTSEKTVIETVAEMVKHSIRSGEESAAALRARLDAIESLLDTSSNLTLDAIDRLPPKDAIIALVKALEAGNAEQLARVEERLEAGNARRQACVQQSLEDGNAQLPAWLQQRLEVAGAAQLARVDDRLDEMKVYVQGRVEQLASQIELFEMATTAAFDTLAPANLVTSLVEGVVALGESVDEEMSEIRRRVAGHQPLPLDTPSSLSGRHADSAGTAGQAAGRDRT